MSYYSAHQSMTDLIEQAIVDYYKAFKWRERIALSYPKEFAPGSPQITFPPDVRGMSERQTLMYLEGFGG